MSQRSIENVEDRVIKMAKTLVRHLDQPKIAYRTNGRLSPKVKKQLYLMVDRCIELSERRES